MNTRALVVILAVSALGCGGGAFSAADPAGEAGAAQGPEAGADAEIEAQGPEATPPAEAGADAGLEAGQDAAPGPEAAAETQAPDAAAEACEPTSCEAQGAACGTIDDGCGHQLDCGGSWVAAPSWDGWCADDQAHPHVWVCYTHSSNEPFPDCVLPASKDDRDRCCGEAGTAGDQ